MTDLRKEIEDALEWVQGEIQALEMSNRALGGWRTKQIARKYDHLKTILRSLEASLKLLDEGDIVLIDGVPHELPVKKQFKYGEYEIRKPRHSEALKTLRGEE